MMFEGYRLQKFSETTYPSNKKKQNKKKQIFKITEKDIFEDLFYHISLLNKRPIYQKMMFEGYRLQNFRKLHIH